MCGLFGWILPIQQQQELAVLARLTNLLAHRGPDGSGYWMGPTAGGEFQIALGHRRLSIIDIEGGNQPMRSNDGLITLVFNGEIYNYIELRKELQALGRRFRTACDTEVLIEAYRVWGPDAITRFRGMFAFVLWDEDSQRLVAARDPFGKKPLFLAKHGGGYLFGSEIEPLIQFPGSDHALDPDAVAHYLLNRYVPGPSTFFRSIKKLPPGCLTIWEQNVLKTVRYFTPPFATVTPDIRRFEDAVGLFQKTFEDAVRLRMRSDAPFGAYLSGGLDSSAVVSTMVQYTGEAVRTFAVGFREKRYSELDQAKLVAKMLGTNHQELVVDSKSFLQNWPEAVMRRGAPASETSDVPILMLSRLASKTVKMVLTGEGADELTGGYPKHRAEPLSCVYQKLIPQFIHDSVIVPAIRALPYGMRRAKIFFAAAGERKLHNRMRLWFGGMSIKERDALLGHSCSEAPLDKFPFSAELGSTVRRTLFFDQTSWLPDDLLERGDRMMMAGSIEGRMPFMDTVLAEVVARCPDSFLIGVRGGKAVLRAAMENLLPKQVLTRKKIAFRVPISEWFRGPYYDFVRELLTSESSHVRRICNRRRIEMVVEQHMSGRHDNDKVLWSLTNLELFFQLYKPSNM